MIDSFEKLEQEKQDKIIRAALSIFADKGYKDASTNKIVEAAEISKGTLFYYFKNKKGLYYYLIDYALEIIQNEYMVYIDYTTTDFIQRMSNNSKAKYRYYQEHPEVNSFLSTVLYSELTSLPDSYQEKIGFLMEDTKNKMMDTPIIAEELFKDEHKPEEAARIIQLAIEGYFSELTEKFKQSDLSNEDSEELWTDFDHFLGTLRTVFYK